MLFRRIETNKYRINLKSDLDIPLEVHMRLLDYQGFFTVVEVLLNFLHGVSIFIPFCTCVCWSVVVVSV